MNRKQQKLANLLSVNNCIVMASKGGQLILAKGVPPALIGGEVLDNLITTMEKENESNNLRG